jgi:hypothetical protein
LYNPVEYFWPSRRQWKSWSLPSKLTAIGTLVGVISLFLYGVEKSFNVLALIKGRSHQESKLIVQPSVMITYENHRINIKNMGTQNVWLWGKKVGSRKSLVEENGRLLTPGGLYYFDAKQLEESIDFDKQSDEKLQIPMELFVQTENQERYVFNNIVYFNIREGSLKIHIQTIGIIKKDWRLY